MRWVERSEIIRMWALTIRLPGFCARPVSSVLPEKISGRGKAAPGWSAGRETTGGPEATACVGRRGRPIWLRT